MDRFQRIMLKLARKVFLKQYILARSYVIKSKTIGYILCPALKTNAVSGKEILKYILARTYVIKSKPIG